MWKIHSAFSIRYPIFPTYLINSCSRDDIKISEAWEKSKDFQEITENIKIFSNRSVHGEKNPNF